MQRQTYLYELLVRGAPGGQIAGAHMIHAERVVQGETVIGERFGVAQPLDPAQAAPLLGAEFVGLVNQVAAANTARDKAEADRKAVEADRDRLAGELAAARAEIAALTVPRGRPTALEFLSRFDQEERIALRESAKSDAILEDILDLFRAAQEIDVADQRTREGVGYMVQRGYLTEARAASLLKP